MHSRWLAYVKYEKYETTGVRVAVVVGKEMCDLESNVIGADVERLFVTEVFLISKVGPGNSTVLFVNNQ